MPKFSRFIVLIGCFGVAFTIAACGHADKIRETAEFCPNPVLLHPQAVTLHPSMMSLAHDLDKVEKYIEWYGTVVPKSPDVWGQARLTKHREEFEEIMENDRFGFEVKMNGALTRADASYAGQAIALAAAVQPRPRFSILGSRTVDQTVNIPGGTDKFNQTSTLSQTYLPTPPTTIGALPTNASVTTTTTTDPKTGITTVNTTGQGTGSNANIDGPDLNQGMLAGTGQSRLANEAIALEPTLVLEQKARYLNLLNQIRRTNEGDDTADSPGYSMNLMRIPVSVFPGTKTEAGYGAEVTFTLTPVLGEDLLPTTFRSLVVNDLVDHLGFPLAKYLESDDSRLCFANHDENGRLLQDEEFLQYLATGIEIGELGSPQQDGQSINSNKEKKVTVKPHINDSKQKMQLTFRALKKHLTVPALSPSKGVLARSPIPNSQILDVFGIEFAYAVAFEVYESLNKDISTHGYAHLPDIQSMLQSELNAAHRFLAEPSNLSLWNSFCTPDLVTAVRNRDLAQLARMRKAFREHFRVVSGAKPTLPSQPNNILPAPVPEPMQFSVTAALSWAILVDSALLTDRLARDMKETATSKGRDPFCSGWLDFAAPCPSPEARHAFNEYVRCRWPIHVFALDPANQDQNLVDELTTRREMQLALSMAFVSGQINANTLTRFARRMDTRYETIALNRTQVGFTHGENTFGWRFYPRFQSPESESRLQSIVRNNLIGEPGTDALLRQRRLEPGPRECVAIVLMPSFVPYVTSDSISNWFTLSNPKHKEFDMTETLRVSRAIKELQVHGPAIKDPECYRDGDFQRLLRRVEQLDARLPTQTQTVQVPVVNTLGGFEMFNSGTTDLAPDLYGFYGAPGVRPDTHTTLFLVGDHFSPLRTKVIVGNLECKGVLLSRQVIQVTVPPGVLETNENYVHAHLSTPYGVTREIRIPMTRALGDTKAHMFLADTVWSMSFKVVQYKDGSAIKYKYVLPTEASAVQPEAVNLLWSNISPMPASVKVAVEFKVGEGDKGIFKWEKTVNRVGNTYAIPTRELVEQLIAKLNKDFEPKDLATSKWSGRRAPTSFEVSSLATPPEKYTVRLSHPLELVGFQMPAQTNTTNPTEP